MKNQSPFRILLQEEFQAPFLGFHIDRKPTALLAEIDEVIGSGSPDLKTLNIGSNYLHAQ